MRFGVLAAVAAFFITACPAAAEIIRIQYDGRLGSGERFFGRFEYDPATQGGPITDDDQTFTQTFNNVGPYFSFASSAFSFLDRTYSAELRNVAGEDQVTFFGEENGVEFSLRVPGSFSIGSLPRLSNPLPNGSFSLVSNSFTTSGTVNLVTIGYVPEPSTWALMIIGFGAIGGAVRGRRFKTATLSSVR